ncbi:MULTISPECIES: ergothioneine biosynthesis protein EgtB [unclassified Ketobacter]|uniref:ergothioneine biosynthesis protein EgtB n=1 Tax=unclassified Ketobacter TaxID=2639109 RepID=UPI000F2B72D2|nr:MULTISPECIES: ergothioneine biosynthesis protein EgtB [unclassified Ketobacter]RLT90504.1 MAG: ergothioneine biosynthesis protein EgtB [Ketobacter sp. GenoA1]RLT99602.1 MAG: ergothioneine biosynthesis protein EgtB [Ketobacter sp.]
MDRDLQDNPLPPLLDQYQSTRKLSLDITEPLHPEDQVIQSMPDASPIKWHLAHTSWFFETFVLAPYLSGYTPYQPEFAYLFNSYYNQVGPQYLRPNRGLISRPTVEEVREYRHHVDCHMARYLSQAPTDQQAAALVELGIHHEQQHQELMLTDIKHGFSFNPLFPALVAYRSPPTNPAPQRWLEHAGGEISVGHNGDGFHFDNESPRHRVLLPPFKLAQRLVTNREYLEFIADGGYRNPLLWLSDGWAWRQQNQVEHPIYWQQQDDRWQHYTLSGLQTLAPNEPVCHISYFEADAFAQWCGKRLPTEFEWEAAAQQATGLDEPGAFLDLACLHPKPAAPNQGGGYQQLYGTCWQWTRSAYSPYPGYKPAAGAVGEYNGKFMCNQWVLKGGSCVSPRGHLRSTYRNFFPAHAQWQFTGIRMADDA